MKAIKELFETAGKRDFGGELPEPPTELTEIGEAAYDACRADILEGIARYWEICESRKPKPPPDEQADISRLKPDISHTQAGYIKNEPVNQETSESKSDYEITVTVGEERQEIDRALKMINDAGIKIDDGLVGDLVNLWHHDLWSDGCIERAVEYCTTHNIKTPRGFTGTLRTIHETDTWRG